MPLTPSFEPESDDPNDDVGTNDWKRDNPSECGDQCPEDRSSTQYECVHREDGESEQNHDGDVYRVTSNRW
jgi:hypothetical protein